MSGSESESYSSALQGANPNSLHQSMDDGSGGSGPRKRVSQACQPCARRKTKCDGAQPICGQCLQRDNHNCSYTESKRNRSSGKSARTSTPTSVLQRPSLGLGDQRSFSSYEVVHHADQQYRPDRYQQQPGFGAMDILAASASRAPPSNMIVPRGLLAQQPLPLPDYVSYRLIKDFFATIHPMWPILYKPMYDIHDDLRSVIPPPLLHAIYSIAACIQSSEENSYDVPAPSQLFETSLNLLQQPPEGSSAKPHPLHLLKPSVENCQTLTILALQQHGVAESSSAAVLFGLATAMAIELRLHRDTSFASDTTEVQIRSRLWWNLYVLDKMLACEMKRPVLIRRNDSDNPFPSKTEADEYQLLSLRTAGSTRVTTVKTHTISGFITTIQLTIIMERVLTTMYTMKGRDDIRDGVGHMEDCRLKLWEDLKDYTEMLDHSPLKLDLNSGHVPAPVTITNMVWMYCSTILIHRPFVGQPPTQFNRAHANASLQPLDICFVASNNICDILEAYAENLPKLSCDMIFPIFTTASTLHHYMKRLTRDDPLTKRRIDLCIRWLAILGKSWKNAGTRQQMLNQDLSPQDISRPNSHPQGSSTPQLKESGHQSPSFRNLTPLPPHNEGREIKSQGEDWTFLNNFGNTGDDFFRMDMDFRMELQNQTDNGHDHVRDQPMDME